VLIASDGLDKRPQSPPVLLLAYRWSGRVHEVGGAAPSGRYGPSLCPLAEGACRSLALCSAAHLVFVLRGLSDSCSGAVSGDGDAIGCWCSGEGDLSPLPGLGVHGGTEPSADALGV
jgi:hypothetical protein